MIINLECLRSLFRFNRADENKRMCIIFLDDAQENKLHSLQYSSSISSYIGPKCDTVDMYNVNKI